MTTGRAAISLVGAREFALHDEKFRGQNQHLFGVHRVALD
jgi:hypothetical protein